MEKFLPDFRLHPQEIVLLVFTLVPIALVASLYDLFSSSVASLLSIVVLSMQILTTFKIAKSFRAHSMSELIIFRRHYLIMAATMILVLAICLIVCLMVCEVNLINASVVFCAIFLSLPVTLLGTNAIILKHRH